MPVRVRVRMSVSMWLRGRYPGLRSGRADVPCCFWREGAERYRGVEDDVFGGCWGGRGWGGGGGSGRASWEEVDALQGG